MHYTNKENDLGNTKEAGKMLNDRDDNKYEDQEESEYHFSDEEVSYEVETESPKTAPSASEPKESILNRLTGSKRMIISLVVFLALVFIVYKMVAPGPAAVPGTDIAPATAATTTTTTTTSPMAQQQPQVQQATQPQTMPAAPVQQLPTSPMTQQQAAIPYTAPQPQAVPGAMPAQPGVAPAMVPVTAQQQSIQAQVQQPQSQYPATMAPASQAMSGVEPMQSSTVPVSGQQPVIAPAVTPTDANVAALANENERLAAQLQSEYNQKLNDYAAQNKNLQDQMQSLNARVASMETQMNQLIQALTRQIQNQVDQTAAQGRIVDTKTAYNVQAIIPGRAWLRADNGETITVAEGDVIKDLGRVTKIDPYDGIVEINTGSKTISLSYGGGS